MSRFAVITRQSLKRNKKCALFALTSCTSPSRINILDGLTSSFICYKQNNLEDTPQFAPLSGKQGSLG